MKKSLLIAVSLLSVSISSNAQMTLEHTYSSASNVMDITNVGLYNEPVSVINLSLSGKKYAVLQMQTSQVTVYNLNHSLWKTITLPTITNCRPLTAYYISENLFKMDGHVDMAIWYQDTVAIAPNYLDKQVVIDEFGTILNTIDSFSTLTIFNTGNDTFKAITGNYVAGGQSLFPIVNYRVYSLPGTIPCNICGNGLGLGKPANNNTLAGHLSDAIPNPNNGSFKIEYSLPAGVTKGQINFYNTTGQHVKSYEINTLSNSLIVDNLDLPSGTYYYNLIASGIANSSKKMIIIK